MVTTTMTDHTVRRSVTSYTVMDNAQTRVNMTFAIKRAEVNTGGSLADDSGLASAFMPGLMAYIVARMEHARHRFRK